MVSKNNDYKTFVQNPKVDFLFGYFGNIQVPTKQDAFKPILDATMIDDNGIETILKDIYVKKPDKKTISDFKKYIQSIAIKIISEEKKIKKPNDVQVYLSISITQKRYFEVDVDNLAKNVLDCLKGIAFDDDCQVSSLIVNKHIHPMKVNGILIAITKITKKRKGLEIN